MSRGSRKPIHTRLYRNTKEGKVMGVCAGIADYFGVDAWAVRVVAVVGLIFFMVPTLAGYFITGALLEPKPNDLYANEEDEKFWRDVRTEPGGTIQELKRRFADIDRRIQGIEAYVTSKEFELNRDIRDLDA